MFKRLTQQLDLEVNHFLSLTNDVRRLLVSYYLYLIAYPLFGIFTNAYLWRQSENLTTLVIYNLIYCFGLPLGFYINGYAYICDNVLTFNLGRSLGLLLVFIGTLTVSQNFSLRYIPLAIALTSAISIFPLIKLSRQLFNRS